LDGLRTASKTLQREDSAIWPPSREADLRAEQLASRADRIQCRSEISSGLSRSDQKDEKAVRQQDGLFFQGRIVPTEFEKDHQNFLAKSYWPAKGSVKEFLENRCLCFQ
jgi:hypothetical protein